MSNPEVQWYDRSSAVSPERNLVDISIVVSSLGEAPKEVPPRRTEAEEKLAKDNLAAKESISKDPATKDFSQENLATVMISPTHLYFEGYSMSKKTTYIVNLELFSEVDPENSTCTMEKEKPDVKIVLRKKTLGEKWVRLPATSLKLHYLKTDWNLYDLHLRSDKDEDQRNAPENFNANIDFSEFLGNSAMGGAEDEEAQMVDDDGEKETEMPKLEGEGEEEEKEAVASTGKPKIEEIP